MLDPSKINELIQGVVDSLPPGLRNMPQEAEENFRAALRGLFNKLDLVSREEFDIQVKVLQKSREKLEALEKRVDEIEPKT